MQSQSMSMVQGGVRPTFQYRTGQDQTITSQSSIQHQLFRVGGVPRVYQSRFEESMRLYAPIKIVATVQLAKAGVDLGSLCHQVLRYFRYHFGAEKVLCAGTTPSSNPTSTPTVEVETSVMLGIEDLQPWQVREIDMLSRNLNLDKQTIGTVIRVRPIDTLQGVGGGGGGLCVALTVPQQWEREIEAVPVGALLPLGSVWWRLLGGYEHPNILEIRLLSIHLGGHLMNLTHLYSLQMNFISAATVLLLEVSTAQEAGALVAAFDGRILQGLGKGSEKHLFPMRASQVDFGTFIRRGVGVGVGLGSWWGPTVLAVPPVIPSYLFEVFNRQLPPVIHAEDEEVTLLPAERWPGGRATWRAERFRANVGEEVAARISKIVSK